MAVDDAALGSASVSISDITVGHTLGIMSATTLNTPLEGTALPGRAPQLLNRDRASFLMRRLGWEALLVASPLNVYYITGGAPVMSRFMHSGMTAALLPADMRRPIAYIGGAFEFYAGVADCGLADGVRPYLVEDASSDPASRNDPAFEIVGNYSFDARERNRRAFLERAAPFHEGMPQAVEKAIKDDGLGRGAIGVDTAHAKSLLAQTAPAAQPCAGDDFMLHLRLIKTAAEMALMRQASAANVEAALVTARAARIEGSLRRVRQRFFLEAARLGNVPVYGSVDLVMNELADGEFREGQAFMIDFVSHYGFYQGDYGRTVFYGEPEEPVRRAADAAAIAWEAIRARLRPGLRFSEIRHIGREAVRKLGVPFTYAFNPHTVGLQHWDQPRLTLDGGPLDLALEEGMVLSVDCPLLSAGVNGTTHLEDLVVIEASGCEPIHPTGNEVIVV